MEVFKFVDSMGLPEKNLLKEQSKQAHLTLILCKH
jgi:hypothetical protein